MTLKLDSLGLCPFCMRPWPPEHGEAGPAALVPLESLGKPGDGGGNSPWFPGWV
jgi:hypothetical protein